MSAHKVAERREVVSFTFHPRVALKLKEVAEAQGVPASRFVEAILAEKLGVILEQGV